MRCVAAYRVGRDLPNFVWPLHILEPPQAIKKHNCAEFIALSSIGRVVSYRFGRVHAREDFLDSHM